MFSMKGVISKAAKAIRVRNADQLQGPTLLRTQGTNFVPRELYRRDGRLRVTEGIRPRLVGRDA